MVCKQCRVKGVTLTISQDHATSETGTRRKGRQDDLMDRLASMKLQEEIVKDLRAIAEWWESRAIRREGRPPTTSGQQLCAK